MNNLNVFFALGESPKEKSSFPTITDVISEIIADEVGPLPAPAPSYIVLPIGTPSTTTALVTPSIFDMSSADGINEG